MADKRATFTIGVNADTSLFMQLILSAISALQKLGTSTNLTKELLQSSLAALELANNLQKATNPATGKFDILTFQQLLARGEKDILSYYTSLSKLGDKGKQAFLNAAQAIAQAELPLVRTNKLMSLLWTTMQNTVRWLITSGILNTLTGAINTAYGYSKDLDKSLNNIRIVTGLSAEEMSRFAKEANDAAKSLNTTTTDYTQASLIYFLQGLSDEEVRERTDATIKMANVSGQDAEKVSEQMTAIWNNFDDGSKKLEYYADVLVALGASTASSSDEISEGVQKFAAVADTVGLSYEYAAAALATLTANTRESADIVGNALKTLFARILGLKLGETLDDGTDLNKYSLALASVGVNVMGVNGELKNMDQILSETAAKWETLNKDQQVALAQTVAGVRQYNLFVALMDSWEDFEKNLETAYRASGALTEQADIYAESWKAARDSVRASAEDIYDSLINPDFYIDIDHMISPLLNRVADIVDGLGGMQGVLSVLALTMNKVYGGLIAASMQEMAVNLGIINKTELKRTNDLREQIARIMELNSLEMKRNGTELEALRLRQEVLAQNLRLLSTVSTYMDLLTPRQLAILLQKMEEILLVEHLISAYVDLYLRLSDLADRYSKDMLEQFYHTENQIRATNQWQDAVENVSNTINERFKNRGITFRININTQEVLLTYQLMIETLDAMSRRASGLTYILEQMKLLHLESKPATQELLNLAKELELIDLDARLGTASTDKFFDEIRQGLGAVSDMNLSLSNFRQTLNNTFGVSLNNSERFVNATKTADAALRAEGESAEIASEKTEELNQSIKDGSLKAKNWSENLVDVGSLIAALTMGLNSIDAAFDTIGDILAGKGFDLDKLTSILSSIGGVGYALSGIRKGMRESGDILKTAAKALGSMGTAAGGAAGKFGALATAITGAASAAAPYIAVAGLVIAVIMGIVEASEKKRQAHIEELQEAQKARQEAMEERAANEELLASYQELLQVYEETGEKKSELDDMSLKIAEAYGVEGGALARLSGELANYNRLLREAKEIREQELKDQRDDALANQADAREVLELSGATGFDLSSMVNDQSTRILEKYIPGMSSGDIGLWNRYETDIDHIGEFYDNLTKARQEMEEKLTDKELEKSDAYEKVVNYIDEMGEKILSYRDWTVEASKALALLGELTGLTITDSDILNYKEYNQWVEEISKSFSDVGMTSEEVEDVIDDIVKTSLNPKIRELKDISDALAQVKELVTDPRLDLEYIFNSGKYDPVILATLKWETITVESFVEAYKSAEKYYGAVKDIENATKTLSDLEEALKVISKAKGDMGIEDWLKVASAVDWGDEEKGIIEYTEFLRMTANEQQEYMLSLILGSYLTMASAIDTLIKERLAELERLLTFYEGMNAKVIDEAYATQEALENLMLAKRDHDAYEQTGLLENFDLEKYELDAERLADVLGDTVSTTLLGKKIFDWEKIVEMSQDELQEAIDKAGEDTKATVQLESNTREYIEQTQEELDSLDLTKEIIFTTNFNKQLETLEGYTSDIMGVFDAISKGVLKTTDEAGNEIYGLTIEAAKAMEEMYPGFIAAIEKNNGALRDGTYALTKDMYDAFFNSVNGLVAVDAKGKMQMILNDITMLEAKRARTLQALEIAKKVASGELSIYSLNEELKELLLELYVNADKIANGELLEEESQVLKDINDGHKTIWQLVSDYSADAAQNMADAFSEMTGVTLSNLVKIRDGVQAIYLGTENGGIFPEFDVTPDRVKVDRGEIVTNLGTTVFIQSLLDAAGGPEEDPWSLDDNAAWHMSKKAIEERKLLSMKAGQMMVEDLEAVDTAQAKYIAALSIAGLNMKTSIQDAIDTVEKEDKKGSKKKDSTAAQKYYVAELEKELEEIQDRYHEITREIEKQSDLLEDIGSNVERSYGVQKLKNYQRELKALEKLQENYNAKLKEATEAWLPRDTQKLKELFGEAAIQIKENGELANYSSLELKIIDDYNNNFLKPYNEFMKKYTETTDKELKNSLEKLKAEWETKKQLADKEYEDRKEALSQYEKTRDVIQEQTDALEENARLIQDNKLSLIEYKLEIILDVKSMKDALRDFRKQALEIFGDALTHGTGGMNLLGITDRELNVAKLMNDLAFAEAHLYESFAAQFRDLTALYEEANDQTDRDRIIQDIMELLGKVLDSAEAIVEWVGTIEDIVPEAVLAAAERFAQFTDLLEHNESVLESIKELYALQGVTYKTAEGFERLLTVSREKLEAQVAQAKLQKKWMEEARENLEMAQARLDALDGDEGSLLYDMAKKARDAYLLEFNDSTDAMLAAAKAAMETARDMYTEQIEKAAYDFGLKVSGGLGLDLLQELLEHRIEESERYFDPVNQAYHTLTWYNKLLKDIDKTTNAAYKENLKLLLKEIDIRGENGTLNLHDLDILEAKYKTLMAIIALEDALNVKNSVKLVRDSQGNWNYQYVADLQEIEDREQALLDATHERYNLELEYVKDIDRLIVLAKIDCLEEIKALEELGIEDLELFARKKAEIEDYYAKKILYLETEKLNAIKGLNEAGNESLIIGAKIAGSDLTELAQVTADLMKLILEMGWGEIAKIVTIGNTKIEELMQENIEFVNLFDNSFAEDLGNMTGNAEDFLEALHETLEECLESFDEYGETVEEVAEETGTTLEELAEMTDEVSESTDMLQDSGLEAADVLWELIDAADQAAESYSQMAEELWAAVEALEALAQALVDYVEAQVGADSYDDIEVPEDVKDWSLHILGNTALDEDYYGSEDYKLDQEERNKKLQSMTGTHAVPEAVLNNIANKLKAGDPKTVKLYEELLEELRQHNWDTRVYNILTKFKGQGYGFDTGGYTGEFEGARLAFLHQKELVLNAKDTENLLTAVDAIRLIDFSAIERMLDSNAMNMFSTLANRLATPVLPATSGGATENNYHIDKVEFPNITSADGIAEAFESLPDEAAQWALIRKS